MNKQVIIKIDQFGNPTITTEGYTGEDCVKATEKLENLFTSDKTRKNVVLAPEYYQAEETENAYN